MSHHSRRTGSMLAGAVVLLCAVVGLAQEMDPVYYSMGSPVYADLYVNPVSGDDSRAGTSAAAALRTMTEAWGRSGAMLASSGVRINLMPGTYPCEPDEAAGDCRNYFADLQGTADHPLLLRALNGPGTVLLRGGMNFNNIRYLYLMDLSMAAGMDLPTNLSGNNVLHIGEAGHVLLHGLTVAGPDGITDMDNTIQEVLKINQSDHVYLEDSDLSGTFQTVVDYFSVQYGHFQNNRIHRSGGRCAYLKGGSAYFRIEANEFYDCREAGIQAGEGSNFPVMRTPFIHYEAYDMKIVNNVLHDIYGAGLSVSGGYDILMAYNTLYKIGLTDEQGRSWGVAQFVRGSRGCTATDEVPDPGPACAALAAQGGWGPNQSVEGEEVIPDRNIFVYDNIFFNPDPARTEYAHLSVLGPISIHSPFQNIPSPSTTDGGLRLRGNIIWNGPADLPLGVEEGDAGCQPSNPTCNAAQLRADNAINQVQPLLVDPAHGDFHPVAAGPVFAVTVYPPPVFSGTDRPAAPATPAGNYSNAIGRDRDGRARPADGPPGAYAYSGAAQHRRPVGPPE